MEENQELTLNQKIDLVKNNEQLSVRDTWGTSNTDALRFATELYQTKHGLYASIPMVCKDSDCPYSSVCPLFKANLTTFGERCALEIALITKKYTDYKSELKIDDNDSIDLSLLKDLIDYDVQLLRAENKMAVEGDFVKEQVIGVDDNGDPILQEVISNSANYKDKIQVRRNKTLELLNSTRKDKAGDKVTLNIDPSSYATNLMAMANKRKIVSEEDEFDQLIKESGVMLDDNGNEIIE